MANNKPQDSNTQNSIDEVNETLTGLEQKVQDNPKVIVWCSLAVAAIIAVILIYVYVIREPGKNAANNAIGQADIELLMGNDSIALAKYQQVAADEGYDGANLANLKAATLLYQKGDYEQALKYLKEYSSSESIIGASSKSLEGDCYVNLKKYNEALDCFKQAVKISDNNPHYTPAFLLKEATVYRELKDYKNEAAIYEQIDSEYPLYGQETGIDIKKYLERAQENANAGA